MARNRILVVEDDEAISRVIIKNLLSTGYAATPIYDGKEAAELLERDADFDLALLDIMLPGIDGFALMGYMKHHDIPVIYLTAKCWNAREKCSKYSMSRTLQLTLWSALCEKTERKSR